MEEEKFEKNDKSFVFLLLHLFEKKGEKMEDNREMRGENGGDREKKIAVSHGKVEISSRVATQSALTSSPPFSKLI